MVSMYNTLKVYYPHLQMFHLLARVQLRNTHPSHHGLEYLTRYVQECVRSSYLSPSFLPSHFPNSPLFPYPPPFLPPPPPPTHTHTHTSLHTAAKVQTDAVAPSLWLIRGDHLLLWKEQCCRAYRLCIIMKQLYTCMAYVFQI